MTSNNPNPSSTLATGKEKRRFKRHTVTLDGVCHLESGIRIACEIQDVCLNGMFIVFKQALDAQTHSPPTINDMIKVECFLPLREKTQTILISAQIVRHFGKGVGIKFNNPGQATLKALDVYIKDLNAERRSTTNTADAPSGRKVHHADREKLVRACNILLGDEAIPMADAFLSLADERLFIEARDAKNNADQSQFFDAMGTFKRLGKSFQESFSASVAEQIASLSPQPGKDLGKDEYIGSELSIMGDDNFEDWLAVKNIINEVQLVHHEIIIELIQRLSSLFNCEISSDNNPYGPDLYVNAFEQALKGLELDHDIKLYSFTVFKDVLSDKLRELYTSINLLLDKNGIQTELKAKKSKTKDHRPEHTKDDKSPAGDNGNPANHVVNEYANDHGDGHTQQQQTDTSDKSHAGGSGGSESQARASRAGAGGPVEAATRTGEYISSNTTGGHGNSGQHDIYQLVQELRQLKKQLGREGNTDTSHISSEQGVTALTGEDNTGQPEQFTTDEIMRALSILQKNSTETGTSNAQSFDFESMTLNILREQIDSSGTNKHIAERDSNIMDVTGNLFDSLLNDMLVAESVRQWIKKLEIPMLKLALKDESIFIDKNHVARQVVNKISQLEGYTSNGSHNAIWKKIDRLLDRIVNNIDSNPTIFDQALHEVDAMVTIQNKAYGENIQDVIRACNEEYAVILKNREANPDKTVTEDYTWQPWEKQARRLQAGDWLLFSNASASSQRLRLAWVSGNLDYYVFVNLKGLKEIALDLVELSMRLRDSTAIVIESANEPALDRAQHTMLDRLHKQLIHESTHDHLTGLINRREFERILDTKLSCAEDQLCQSVLCYMDIAQFNVINSSYGYDAGDKLLLEFTDMMLRALNGMGLLARVGSDTYTLLLDDTTASEARIIIQTQIDTFKIHRFEWQDKQLSISLNVGMVPINDFNTNAAELIRKAEICCRTAKEKGNNQIHIYQRDDHSMIHNQRIIQHVLQIGNTLERGNIELRYQPIVPIQTGKMDIPYHSEILIGIKDDEGNTIPTQDFIVSAEHYNRITAVDRWVITSTFKWIKQNLDLMPRLGGVAINLSGRSINDESFLTYVLEQIEKSGVPTKWICFEITETSGITNLSDATVFIDKLKDTGCHFSLDDFGSGLSSYAYLKNLPVDYLKIDGAFVREMDKNQTDYAVVKSICEIGHFMGKKIIAECVENDAILKLLKEIGVDYAQGYGIEKPKPLSELVSAKKRQ